MDETKEHLLDGATEYDFVSNIGSFSGESEDHQKEKIILATQTMHLLVQIHYQSPMLKSVKKNKKLENKRKHQRQRERRAQDLHERCCSYLTSRQLESLPQKLVNMAFISEAATMVHKAM